METRLDVRAQSRFIQGVIWSCQQQINISYCQLLSDIWRGKYVSRSVCLMTFPLWSRSLFHPPLPPCLLSHSCLSFAIFLPFSSSASRLILAALPGSQRLLLSSKHVCPQLHPVQHRDQLRYGLAQATWLFLPCCSSYPLTVLVSSEPSIRIKSNLPTPLLLCTDLMFCLPFRCVGLLPYMQQAHEQSIPAGNVTTLSHSFVIACINDTPL